MSATSPMQTIVNLLGTFGPLTGTDIITRSNLDAETVKREVFGLMQGGHVTQDGSYFDVVESLRVPNRDAGKDSSVVYDEGATPAAPLAPTAPTAPAAPRQVAPAPPAAPAAPPKPKGGGKKTATAPAAPQGGVAVPNAPQQETQRTQRLYFSDAMDTLTPEELQKRIEVGMQAAAANAQYGGDNALVAEILERWCIRAQRRIKSIARGKSVVRAKGSAGGDE